MKRITISIIALFVLFTGSFFGFQSVSAQTLDTDFVISSVMVSRPAETIQSAPTLHRVTFTGQLPSGCYTLTAPEVVQTGNMIDIRVGKYQFGDVCPILNMPFTRFKNVYLSPGTYTVTINGEMATEFTAPLDGTVTNEDNTEDDTPDDSAEVVTVNNVALSNPFLYIYRATMDITLSDECYKVTTTDVNRVGKNIYLTINTRLENTEESCNGTPESHTVNRNLNTEELSSGTYKIFVNGSLERTLTIEEEESDDPDDSNDIQTSTTDLDIAGVNIETISILQKFGNIYQATITGNVPSRCYNTGQFEIEKDGNTFYVFIGKTYRGEPTCPLVTEKFEHTYNLNSAPLQEGTYTVVVNNQKQSSFSVNHDTDTVIDTNLDIEMVGVSNLFVEDPTNGHIYTLYMNASSRITGYDILEPEVVRVGNTFNVFVGKKKRPSTRGLKSYEIVQKSVNLNDSPLANGTYRVIINHSNSINFTVGDRSTQGDLVTIETLKVIDTGLGRNHMYIEGIMSCDKNMPVVHPTRRVGNTFYVDVSQTTRTVPKRCGGPSETFRMRYYFLQGQGVLNSGTYTLVVNNKSQTFKVNAISPQSLYAISNRINGMSLSDITIDSAEIIEENDRYSVRVTGTLDRKCSKLSKHPQLRPVTAGQTGLTGDVNYWKMEAYVGRQYDSSKCNSSGESFDVSIPVVYGSVPTGLYKIYVNDEEFGEQIIEEEEAELEVSGMSTPSTTTYTSNVTTPPTSTLRKGDSGIGVSSLQNQLASRGYNPGVVDGRFGNGTRSALMAFQRQYGLSADGVAGPATYRALYGNQRSGFIVEDDIDGLQPRSSNNLDSIIANPSLLTSGTPSEIRLRVITAVLLDAGFNQKTANILAQTLSVAR
jgi:hypothetical protein